MRESDVSDRLVLLRDARVVADGATPDPATVAARLRAVSAGPERSRVPA